MSFHFLERRSVYVPPYLLNCSLCVSIRPMIILLSLSLSFFAKEAPRNVRSLRFGETAKCSFHSFHYRFIGIL